MKSGGSISHLEDTVWTELVQDIDEGIMIRFIRMKKDYSTYGKIMREITEPCRVVIERGMGAVWYEKRDSMTIHAEKEPYKKNNKEGCIRSYNFPKQKNFGGVYQKNLRSVLKKAYPYHTFWAFFERKGRKKVEQYDVYDFFDAYSRFPLLESLEKTGKYKIVDYLCDGKRRNFEKFNRKAKNISELLGISRQQYREIQNPDMEQIKMLHILNEKGIRVDEKGLNQLRFATSEYSRKNEIETILKYMSIRKFLKYVKNKNLHDVKEYYFDYLDMAEQNGFDMKNTFVLFPKNIREAHDEVLDIINEQRNKKQLEEERKQDKDIMEVEQKIRKKFTFEDDNLIIRPAKTAVEILKEGQTQHICVGNGNYRDKMIREKSFILFLRKKEEKDKPFYTVEITPDYHIIQRHGKHNKEGEEVKMVDAFLKKFVEVKSNGKEHYTAG